MSTFVAIHGAGDSAASWDAVGEELAARGHELVAVDLPCEDDAAGWAEYAGAVLAAIGDRTDVHLVAHSLGGFTATLVADRSDAVAQLIFVAAMVPEPGETGTAWWSNTGHDEAAKDAPEDENELFFGDVADPAVIAAAWALSRGQSGTPMGQALPIDALPDVPTRFLLCREDRFFPADFARGLARDRLGVEADEIDGGHCPFVSRPAALAERLDSYAG